MTIPQRPRRISVHQAATLLDVSRMTVYRLIDRKELRAYRVGRSLRIDPADIDTYLRGASTFLELERGDWA